MDLKFGMFCCDFKHGGFPFAEWDYLENMNLGLCEVSRGNGVLFYIPLMYNKTHVQLLTFLFFYIKC